MVAHWLLLLRNMVLHRVTLAETTLWRKVLLAGDLRVQYAHKHREGE